MTGHRIRTGKPRHAVTRNKIWRGKFTAALTAEQQYDVAADWLRASAHRHQDVAKAEQVLADATRFLAERADALDHETITTTSARGRA
jgi:hypothetical protein